MDLNYFREKEGTIEVDMTKNKIKGYAKGKEGFLEQIKRLRE